MALFRHAFCMKRLGISKNRLKKYPYSTEICSGVFGTYEAHAIKGRDLATLFKTEYNAVSAADYTTIKRKSDERKTKAKITAVETKKRKDAERAQVYENRIRPFHEILQHKHQIPPEKWSGRAFAEFVNTYVEHQHHCYNQPSPNRTHIPTDSPEYKKQAELTAQSMAFRIFLHTHTDYNDQVSTQLPQPGIHALLRHIYQTALANCNFAPVPPWPWAQENQEQTEKQNFRITLRELENTMVDFGGGAVPVS